MAKKRGKSPKKRVRKKPPKKKTKPARAKKNGTGNGTRRQAGRPLGGEEIVTPEVLERIGDLYLRGGTLRNIAEAVDVSKRTIEHHLEHSIKPLWQSELIVNAREQLARVEYLYRIAWERFESSSTKNPQDELAMVPFMGIFDKLKRHGEVQWLDVVKWCIDYTAKIGGLYAAKRVRLESSGGLRVAGKTPSEVDAETVGIILERMKQRRSYQEAVAARSQND